MSDLVERARIYATQAHQRIGQLRKYSKQPYHVHLEAVAKQVAGVTDDEEMIAAAWLHDTVEDTPATLEDIEAHFGTAVAELVEELTDVSKPSDGNRATRKAIDRDHTAQASLRAKTVKLADLIDNCRDITKHDERFAKVYLVEMGALLDVLGEGDAQLFQEAVRVYALSMEKLGFPGAGQKESEVLKPDSIGLAGFDDRHFKRMFMELFTARDIAEGLLSFDSGYDREAVRKALTHHRQEVASVRVKGTVQGYLRLSDVSEAGEGNDTFRNFTVDQVLPGSAPLADVIHVLTRHDYCFITVLGDIAGVICRDDINKPMVRMWLFGIVTMIEMGMVQLIEERFPDESWQGVISEGRLGKAQDIQAERQRRNQYCSLIDCLQLSDKAQILINDELSLAQLGFDSKATAKRGVRELESLRNHLAHAQDIVMHDWAQIARMTRRMEEITRG
ncbi:MAG TPA: bifunctional (p)ppGpp synthetase/guanosine-3',5'-bis(diphosphate) 3'-pyrophosphohydrolase [Gammaproteobacteria bacterium]|nr:bifunctional (p)ppGpp synthetase/guanosine-3',5'-bis(diphosphate) 3'-pyrophosphohydrolase [Gammaproteobacteria bacterium]